MLQAALRSAAVDAWEQGGTDRFIRSWEALLWGNS